MDLPENVAVMTLPSATLFPQALLPLYIFEPRYRRMLRDALESHRMFVVAMQDPARTREKPCPVAGLGLIRVSVDHNDGTSHLVLQGITRIELVETVQTKPYRRERFRLVPTPVGDGSAIDALRVKVMTLVQQRLALAPDVLPFPALGQPTKGKGKSKKSSGPSLAEVLSYLEDLPGPEQFADLVACALLPGGAERQLILSTIDLEVRLRRLAQLIEADIERLKPDNLS